MKLFIQLFLSFLTSLFIFGILFVPTHAQTIINGGGWHLVAPGEYSDIDTLIASHPNIDSIWGWAEGQWKVKFRSPPENSSFKELTTLKKNFGYWIRTKGDVTLQETSDVISQLDDHQLSQDKGWFLLGTAEGKDTSDSFFDSLSHGSTLWLWRENRWMVYTKGDEGTTNQFNTKYGTEFSNLRYIYQTEGFWVNQINAPTICDNLLQLATASEMAQTPRNDVDAEWLAIHAKETFVADQTLYERISLELQTLREKNPLLETVHDLLYPFETILTVQLTAEGDAAYDAGTYNAWNCLNDYYGMSELKSRKGTIMTLYSLKFPGKFDTRQLEKEYQKLAHVRYADFQETFINGNGYDIDLSINDNQHFYLFSQGQMDCPAGCIVNETWCYTVDELGNITDHTVENNSSLERYSCPADLIKKMQ